MNKLLQFLGFKQKPDVPKGYVQIQQGDVLIHRHFGAEHCTVKIVRISKLDRNKCLYKFLKINGLSTPQSSQYESTICTLLQTYEKVTNDEVK